MRHFIYTVCEMKPQSLGQFEQLVMTAILQCGRNAYGVTIHQGVEKLSGGRRVSLGAVYATLDRLEDKGLIASWLSDPTPERGGRSKRCYQLKAGGERALRESALCARRICDALEQAWGSPGSWSAR
jgi:PadR family transcriptional regulator, regulatory protein PadR